MERTDRVYLDAAEPRCAASLGCTQKARCARAVAMIARGSPVADYSQRVLQGGGTDLCIWFRGLGERAPDPAPRETHPAVPGM